MPFKSIKVSEQCWVTLGKLAIDQRCSIGQLVEQLANAGQPANAPARMLATPAAQPRMRVIPNAPQGESASAENVPCRLCGTPLRDHRGGNSGRLSTSTNCRTYTLPEESELPPSSHV